MEAINPPWVLINTAIGNRCKICLNFSPTYMTNMIKHIELVGIAWLLLFLFMFLSWHFVIVKYEVLVLLPPHNWLSVVCNCYEIPRTWFCSLSIETNKVNYLFIFVTCIRVWSQLIEQAISRIGGSCCNGSQESKGS